MKTLTTVLALGALALVTQTGCENKEHVIIERPIDTPSESIRLGSTDPAIIGTWMFEEGDMFPDLDAWIDVTALEFPEDGLGWIHFKDTLTGAMSRTRMYCVYDGEKMVVDLSREPLIQYYFPERRLSFPVVVIDEDELSVADENDVIAMFLKQPSLPPGAGVGELSFGSIATGLPNPHYFTDLVPFGGDVVYSDVNKVVQRWDIDTQSLGATAGTMSRYIQARRWDTPLSQFVTHCACGGTPGVWIESFTAWYDQIDTETDLNHRITVRGAEWVPQTGRLWLHGRNVDSSYGEFLVIDSNAEPDVLEETHVFNRDLSGLTWDGTHFWAIVRVVSPAICRIDPNTMKVVDSYRLPDDGQNWIGIARADDGNLHLLGRDEDAGTGLTASAPIPSVRLADDAS